ncbi:alpha/beta hydrolase fold domain-containing protein [Roseibium marinum]|uniref:Acetyl esterase/lipase n=1 Tax=Roseibium marinum TaxID=281252 RepID=A0A2S3UTW7_9HYPH|nr:alpha/beta hydrolase [Roseibium marinum]POF31010.1 acetyl esterase/lipase [Roseibium marinum]
MTILMKELTLDKVAIGPVAVRVYEGSANTADAPVLVFFHGGAFTGTLPERSIFSETAAQAGAIVVLPDYNAPLGGVFPKPLETGFSIFSRLAQKRAGLGNRKSKLLVGGVEAGANVAAAVALKARDHYADELDGQILLSPLLDPYMASASMREAEALGMRECWSEGWSHYLSGGVCHPYAAPCTCSRLSGVAPALVLTSGDDPLRDETLGYAAALKAAGVDVHQHVLPAGTGWPSIYGAKSDDTASWQASAARQFTDFVDSLGIQ